MAETEDTGNGLLGTAIWGGLIGQDAYRGIRNPEARYSVTARRRRARAAKAAAEGGEAASKTSRASTAMRRGFETAKATASRAPRVLEGGRDALNATRAAEALNSSRALNRIFLGGGGRVASKLNPAGWMLEAGMTGAQVGEAFYGTGAGKAYANAINNVPGLGGEDTFESGEGARGLLGNLGRGFAALPFGPTHHAQERLNASEQSSRLTKYDTNNDDFISEEEWKAGQARASQAAEQARQGEQAGSDPVMDILNDAISTLEAQGAATQIGFEQKIAELREVFALTEDPGEQAQLAFILGDLEAQRDAAMQAIGTAFGQAQADVDRYIGQTGSGAGAGAAFGDAAGAAEAALAEFGDYGGDTGLGVAATDMTADITSRPGDLREQGANAQGLGDALSASASRGLEELDVSLGRQNAAQQGALQREYLRSRTGAVVADQERQAAEQDAFRQAALQLWMQDQADGGNTADIIDLMLQKAAVLEGRRGEGSTWQPSADTQRIIELAILAQDSPGAIEALVNSGELTREEADAILGLTLAP